MLAIQKRTHKRSFLSVGLTVCAVLLMSGGIYMLMLVSAPSIAPLIAVKPINVNALPAPKDTENLVVIPKIGVSIHYAPSAASLDRGAQWRYPERGNPVKGGNFIIAAHRFSIQPTPQGTVEKSPFYNIDKLIVGDKIVIDYLGTRYAYEIDKTFTVKPTQIEVEAVSDTPKLTLYSCELGGSDEGRVVITAKPLGKVALAGHSTVE